MSMFRARAPIIFHLPNCLLMFMWIYLVIAPRNVFDIELQCNLDYPDSLGPNKTVRISYSPDKRGQFIHSGIDMELVSTFG